MSENQITSVENAIQNKISNTPVELSSAEVALNMDGHEMQKENRPRTSAEEKNPTGLEEKCDEVVIDIVKDSEKVVAGKSLTGFKGNQVSQVYWARPETNQQQQPADRGLMTMHYPEDHVYVPYDPKSRNGFIRLVFIILLVMLLVTALLVFICLTVIGIMTISITMACYPYARRLPCNIILLVFAVILFTGVCARVCVHFKTNVLFMALLITAALVFACFLLACTSFDFTSYLLYVFGISMALALVGVIIVVVKVILQVELKGITIAFLVVSVILQVVTLIIELQMVLGGKAVELEENDYALAAFLLYSSIINLFITIVQLLGLTS